MSIDETRTTSPKFDVHKKMKTLDQRSNISITIDNQVDDHCLSLSRNEKRKLKKSVYDKNKINFIKEMEDKMPFAPDLNR